MLAGMDVYTFSFIILSVCAASFASFIYLDFIWRSRTSNLQRARSWNISASIALGLGIWTVHMVGMLADRSHFTYKYHAGMMFGSLLIVVLAELCAMMLIEHVNSYLFVLACFVMGGGMSLMQFTGMAAASGQMQVEFAAVPFVLFMAAALCISFAALYQYYLLHNRDRPLPLVRKTAISVLLGLAFPVMHDMGMYAASGEPSSMAATGLFSMKLGPYTLSLLVVSAGFCLLGFIFIGIYINKKIAVHAAEINALQFKIIFEHSPDLVCTFDREGRFLSTNPAARTLWGYTEDELIHEHFRSFIIEEDISIFNGAFMYVRQGRPQEICVRVNHKSGRVLDFHITLVPISFQRRLVHTYAIAKDITEIRKHEELMRKSERLDVAGQLAASVAHEMRNPLTSVKGLLQLIKGGKGKDYYYEIITMEIEQMERTISELLVLTSPSNDMEPVDLVELIENAIVRYHADALEKEIHVSLRTGEEKYTILCYKSQLDFVFKQLMNLILKSAELHGEVAIQVNKTGIDEVTVQILEHGLKLTQDSLSRLGEPHYKTDEDGTGLDMMVVYKIVSDHKGTILVESSHEDGTTVTLTFPRVR